MVVLLDMFGVLDRDFSWRDVPLKWRLASVRLKEILAPGQSDFGDVVSTNYSQYQM